MFFVASSSDVLCGESVKQGVSVPLVFVVSIQEPGLFIGVTMRLPYIVSSSCMAQKNQTVSLCWHGAHVSMAQGYVGHITSNNLFV